MFIQTYLQRRQERFLVFREQEPDELLGLGRAAIGGLLLLGGAAMEGASQEFGADGLWPRVGYAAAVVVGAAIATIGVRDHTRAHGMYYAAHEAHSRQWGP